MAQNVTLSKKTGAVKSTTSPRRKVSYPGKPLCLSDKSPSQSNFYDNFDYEDDSASTHKPTTRRSMGKSTEQLDFVENFMEKNCLSKSRTSLLSYEDQSHKKFGPDNEGDMAPVHYRKGNKSRRQTKSWYVEKGISSLMKMRNLSKSTNSLSKSGKHS